MQTIMNISREELLYHMRITCQIPTFLKGIATRRIIADAAKNAEIEVSRAELQQAADSLRLSNKLLKAEDTWSWLKKYHLSLDEFEHLAYTNLLSNKLAIHLFADQVEQFFYQNQIDYGGAVTYEVILDDEYLTKKLFYALQEGKITFQEIVRQYSKNPELRRDGEYQGIRKRTDFRPEIAAAVFAATPPQIIKPIITSKGVHLIWVEEIIQPQLDEQLRAKILGDLFVAWLEQQIEKLQIVIQLED